jgi:hypothetical protein
MQVTIDQAQLSLSDRWELMFWCERFAATPDQLFAAVAAVGAAGSAVAAYLAARGQPKRPST